MAELADALASGASNRKVVEVQVLSRGPERRERKIMAKKIKVAKLNRNNNHRHSVKRGRKMLKYLKNV